MAAGAATSRIGFTLGPFAVAVVMAVAATFLPFPELAAGVICCVLLFVELRLEQTSPTHGE